MRLAVMLSGRSRSALDERLSMLGACCPITVYEVSRQRPTVIHLATDEVPYLLDVNQATCLTALALTARRTRWILDTGDHPATLARNMGRGRTVQGLHGSIDNWMIRHASVIVHRGSFHQALLGSLTKAPLCFAPDTVDDRWLEWQPPSMDPHLLCSFGSAGRPREGDRAYGWEVVDAVAALGEDYRGVLVVAGEGAEVLRERARRLGVHDRVVVHDRQPLSQLVDTVSGAAFATSIQSFDLAGWVRTTGKLPLYLAMGKYVLTTGVGEATRLLPRDAQLHRDSDAGLVEQLAAQVASGIPSGWPAVARHRAASLRRSSVAADLRNCLIHALG